ncbi:hypothetical protein ACIP4U_33875 [Streptomyces caelestis]|uniref:hypothetical protein n=1 Tax=Streptomyces caelestis TaxID=36816 RepID=UPI0037F3A622
MSVIAGLPAGAQGPVRDAVAPVFTDGLLIGFTAAVLGAIIGGLLALVPARPQEDGRSQGRGSRPSAGGRCPPRRLGRHLSVTAAVTAPQRVTAPPDAGSRHPHLSSEPSVETKELSRAYKELLAAAECIADDSLLAESDRARVDWTLAHIALSDQALVGAGRAVLASREAHLDNAQAMSKSEIGRIISSTTHGERAEMVRRTAMELVDLLDLSPDEAADAMVRACLVDREGAVVFDEGLKWGDLIRMRAKEHIPGYTAALRSWARGQIRI